MYSDQHITLTKWQYDSWVSFLESKRRLSSAHRIYSTK